MSSVSSAVESGPSGDARRAHHAAGGSRENRAHGLARGERRRHGAAVRLHHAQAPRATPRASRARCRLITGATYAFTTEVLVRSYSRCSRDQGVRQRDRHSEAASARPSRRSCSRLRVRVQAARRRSLPRAARARTARAAPDRRRRERARRRRRDTRSRRRPGRAATIGGGSAAPARRAPDAPGGRSRARPRSRRCVTRQRARPALEQRVGRDGLAVGDLRASRPLARSREAR